MIISKDEFCNIINRLMDYNILQDRINDIFKDCIDNSERDFCNAGSICIGHESVVINLLDKMFNTDTVSWWIYEMNYGKDFEIGDIVEENGDTPDLSTSEKLYDYLVKKHEELEKENEYISKEKIKERIKEYYEYDKRMQNKPDWHTTKYYEAKALEKLLEE